MGTQPKVVFTAGGMSPVHILQIVCLAFSVGGCFLAYKLANGPEEALNSSGSKLAWAIALAVTALAAPVLSWYYGRKIASRITLSDDGKAWIRDANLIGATHHAWPVDKLTWTGFTSGDPQGEQAVTPPRVTLTVNAGDTQRSYIVPLRGKRQMAALRDSLPTLNRG